MPAHEHAAQEQAVSLWRKLRSPFMLPCLSAHEHTQCHVCEWQKIDIDVLGCVVCGSVHVCEYGKCKQTIETGDALVCEFSGVVIHTKKFVESEYMDTMTVTGVEITELQQVMHGDVEQIVTTILCSQRHTRLKNKALTTTLMRCCVLEKNNKCNNNLLQVCMELLTSFSNNPYVFSYVGHTNRRQLVDFAIKHCCRVLHILLQYGMIIRTNEIQRLTVGILYLMRCGVIMDGIEILPCKKELRNLLPPESTLLSSFGVHPKYITEMENRLKFCLRHKRT